MDASDEPGAKTRVSNGHTATCALCGRGGSRRSFSVLEGLRPALAEFLAERHPREWQPEDRICRDCMGTVRVGLVMRRLEQERGELSAVESDIARKAAAHLTLASDIEEEFEKRATPGQRLADSVAAIGGSWPFVTVFLVVLAIWAVVNSWILGTGAFDPYPYILLNLFLSSLAAIQAPIIMMSQNRVAARDRMQADEDFRTNLKAEIEIATLHEKVDHLLHVQYQRMVELQELQIELLEDLASRRKH